MWVMVRYKLKPDQVERELELLRAVYEELGSVEPSGLRYASFQLEDKVSFVEFVEGENLPGVLPQLEKFQRYRETLDERCDKAPVMTELHEVGTFRFTDGPPAT